MKRLRVVLALPHLARDGGAERVMLTLLKRIDRRHFEPFLLIMDASQNQLSAEVPHDVPVVDLGVRRVRHAPLPLIRALRRLQPAAVLSGTGHLNLMIAIMRPLLPRALAVVGQETVVVSVFNADFRTRRLRDFAYRRFYSKLDLVICQSEGVRADLIDRYGFPAERARLIPNPIDTEWIHGMASAQADRSGASHGGAADADADADATDRPLRLLAIGRLAPQKNFDLLLDAIALLPLGSCRLELVGEGPQQAALAARIVALSLQEVVALRGYHANPYAFMQRADALVLSSRYEGMSDVVLEALAVGTRVIVMPCPGGVEEIARRAGGVTVATGISAAALADAIRTFMARRGEPAMIDVGPYRAEAVVRQYEDVLGLAVTRAQMR